jgi:hypothetical protein
MTFYKGHKRGGSGSTRKRPTATDFLDHSPGHNSSFSSTGATPFDMADTWRRGSSPRRGSIRDSRGAAPALRVSSDEYYRRSRSNSPDRERDRDRGSNRKVSSSRHDYRASGVPGRAGPTPFPEDASYRPIYSSPPPRRENSLDNKRGNVDFIYTLFTSSPLSNAKRDTLQVKSLTQRI